ncbi:serine/threonine-protein kinase [Streptomyces laurentii]|uniref:hypothetical protein n=1 Tax=Streptomyces laurentii TaxID=39478 RepID=UPI0036999237
MADERYAWLDQEAAERLLRGEPVDPVDRLDDTARDEARLLARALESARTPSPPLTAVGPDGELPGEAAALAAFRASAAGRAAGTARVPAASAGAGMPADLGAVRLAPVAGSRRWGRSLRYGLAAAFAAVTVGGVAVAAGTGVLPLTSHPAAREVTAVDTPGPGNSTTAGGVGSELPALPSGGPGRPSGTPGTSAPGVTPGASEGASAGVTTGPGRGTGPDPDEDGEGAAGRARSFRACQDFRAGTLAPTGRQRLANLLRNGETVKRYCDRLLSGGPDRPSTTPSAGRTPSGGRTSSGNNGGSGNGNGNGNDNGTGSGSGSGSGSGNNSGNGGGSGSGSGADGGDSEGDGNQGRGDKNHGRSAGNGRLGQPGQSGQSGQSTQNNKGGKAAKGKQGAQGAPANQGRQDASRGSGHPRA